MKRETRVFHEMEGAMWLHEGQRRLAARAFDRVREIAGGLLGAGKGGHFGATAYPPGLHQTI